jgi:hypothetical protein
MFVVGIITILGWGCVLAGLVFIGLHWEDAGRGNS